MAAGCATAADRLAAGAGREGADALAHEGPTCMPPTGAWCCCCCCCWARVHVLLRRAAFCCTAGAGIPPRQAARGAGAGCATSARLRSCAISVGLTRTSLCLLVFRVVVGAPAGGGAAVDAVPERPACGPGGLASLPITYSVVDAADEVRTDEQGLHQKRLL